MITGGYYIKARCIQDSEISRAAPVVRELWDYLIRTANFSDNLQVGIPRGSTVKRIADIKESLHWFVGYRKVTYSSDQCENAMKWLMNHDMITYTKTVRGMFITVCKYETYQDFKNYEVGNEGGKKTGRRLSGAGTINKEEEGIKEGEQEILPFHEKSWISNNCIFSPETKKEWIKLCGTKKWKKKELTAIEKSLFQLMKYPDLFARSLIDKAIAGDYMGVVFDDTDASYQKWSKLNSLQTTANNAQMESIFGIPQYKP